MSNKVKDKANKATKGADGKKDKDQAERETRLHLQKIAATFKKSQAFIVTLLLMIGLMALIMLMSSIFNRATDTSGNLEMEGNISFDQKTIDQIIELDKVNEQIPTIDNSGGRINPFSDR